MENKLFQNDNITGNSFLGFEIKGVFKDDEDVLLDKLKNILNRDIVFSTTEYKLLEPTPTSVVVTKNNSSHLIKTPMYSYFEAIFILPKLLEYLNTLKTYKNSYMFIKLGFNENFVDITHVNILKFIFEFKEDFILKSIGDITKKTNIKKISDIKPFSLEDCTEPVQKQVEGYRYLSEEDDDFGLSFTDLTSGYLLFKYIQDINYRNKWEDILKCINHTLIVLYNTSVNKEFDEGEITKIDKLNETYKEYNKAFSCYEMFCDKYKSIKLTIDLNNDKSVVNMIYPAIKDRLFNVTIYNNITSATINYDTDVSKLQIKDVDLKDCYNLNNIDIVNCDIVDSCIKDCDLYDCNIDNSTIRRCNLFGFSDCKDSTFDDCFISRNIKLKDCLVYGQLGKMGGTMIGGELKNTTVMKTMADIHDNVEKENVNEIQ